MTKRKLTRKQSLRIQKNQNKSIVQTKKQNSQINQQLDNCHLGPEQQGLVIANYGAQLDVEPLNNVGKTWRCHLRANLPPLVTGDKVIWRTTTNAASSGVVTALDQRDNLFSRPDQRGNLKPIAANIDYIVLVIAPAPIPYTNLIDRYLVAAEALNIEPVILINKTDLLVTSEDNQLFDSIQTLYKQVGYRVLKASTVIEEGLASLQELLKKNTSIFVGQSGVGKSSLVNALLPDVDMQVGPLSESSGQGTHTTTSAKLCHFSTGGRLIDSPGIREFGLWHMGSQDIINGFREFRPLLGHCRFRNCKHVMEPGCAIQEALKRGVISQKRVDSYWQIINSFSA